MSLLKIFRKVRDVGLALLRVFVGIVWGLFKRYVAAVIGIGIIALFVAVYDWVSSENFPSVEVLVIDACEPDGCKWQRAKGQYGDKEEVF